MPRVPNKPQHYLLTQAITLIHIRSSFDQLESQPQILSMSLHNSRYSAPASAGMTQSRGARALHTDTRSTKDHLAGTQALVDLLRRQRLFRNSVSRSFDPRPSRHQSVTWTEPDGATIRGSSPASYSHPEDYLHRFEDGGRHASPHGVGSRYGGHTDNSYYTGPPLSPSYYGGTNRIHDTQHCAPPWAAAPNPTQMGNCRHYGGASPSPIDPEYSDHDDPDGTTTTTTTTTTTCTRRRGTRHRSYQY